MTELRSLALNIPASPLAKMSSRGPQPVFHVTQAALYLVLSMSAVLKANLGVPAKQVETIPRAVLSAPKANRCLTHSDCGLRCIANSPRLKANALELEMDLFHREGGLAVLVPTATNTIYCCSPQAKHGQAAHGEDQATLNTPEKKKKTNKLVDRTADMSSRTFGPLDKLLLTLVVIINLIEPRLASGTFRYSAGVKDAT